MILCGIDEAGRGPLAGPLVVAGVIFERRIYKLGDSKKLSSATREKLYHKILQASRYHIVVIDNHTIDDQGLSASITQALRQILQALRADRYIFDGNSRFGVEGITPIIKADGHIKEVMAASILAKVTRDRIMRRLHLDYPQYGFCRHKGYGTKEHIEAIRRYGLSPIHRRSFRPKSLQPTLFD
ncbi:MAG: ribonuclease HII [Epsilonproteobacteria bacterium]|nr:ribonuclease HII [Campylobacterota bacterium]NPA64292.1 ribonuclease HII [Campylobacterota bacterium]